MIDVKRVSKHYGKEVVLSNCLLSIDPSLVTALVAPNGFGKSTLIKLLINSLFVTSGEIVKPEDLSTSYLSENLVFPDTFTVKEILYQEAILHGINLEQVWENQVVKTFKLESFKQKKCKQLSKGMQQKLAIAKTLLSNPYFLILDEPFNGLDAIGREQLISFVKDRKDQKKGTLLSSHILFSMEDFCDVIYFMGNKKELLQLDIRNELYLLIKVDDNFDNYEQLKSNSIYSNKRIYLITEKSFKKLNIFEDSVTVLNKSNYLINDLYKIVYGQN